uniref:Uncharacterized protein n=1 Tax=Eutreptiella gymnastica TaxID=73025 RepID=A0A7S4G5P9_9EUGL
MSAGGDYRVELADRHSFSGLQCTRSAQCWVQDLSALRTFLNPVTTAMPSSTNIMTKAWATATPSTCHRRPRPGPQAPSPKRYPRRDSNRANRHCLAWPHPHVFALPPFCGHLLAPLPAEQPLVRCVGAKGSHVGCHGKALHAFQLEGGAQQHTKVNCAQQDPSMQLLRTPPPGMH